MNIPVFDISAKYQGGFSVPRERTDLLVVHHAAALYRTATGPEDVASIANWHVHGRGWSGIGYGEVLAEMTNGGSVAAYVVSDPLTQRAHIWDRNDHAWGICAATNFGDQLPDEKWIAGLAARLAEAKRRFPKAKIVGHGEAARKSHPTSCPGGRWLAWKPRLLELVDRELAGAGSGRLPASYSELSGLRGPGQLSAEQAAAYVIRRGCVYPAHDVRVIANHFAFYARAAGLNFDLVWAQVLHETSEQQPSGAWWPLSSWWAQRPRRNGGGLGVTGKEQRARPATPARFVDGDLLGIWARRPDGLWAEGISFPTWEHAARAHIGRLVLYAIGSGETRDQQELAAYANRVRRLAEHGWGSVATLKALGREHNPANIGRPEREHVGWAWPGTHYGASIARVANQLLEAI
jgi:hypothetical protein